MILLHAIAFKRPNGEGMMWCGVVWCGMVVAWKVNETASNFHLEYENRVLDDALLVQPHRK